VAQRDGRLIGALPLVISRRAGVRVAQFPGGEQASLMDALGEDAIVAELVRRAVDQDYARLHNLGAGSAIARLGSLQLVERVEAPVLNISDGWDATYARRTTGKRRTRHRRNRRELEEMGRLETIVARTRDELGPALDETFRVHELRWAGRYDGSGYTTPVSRAFHHAALRKLAALDVARIVLLRLDGAAIAFQFWLNLGERGFVYRIGFDPNPRFYAASPGQVNTFDAMAAATHDGVRTVEWLGAADEFKLAWSDRFDPVHDGFGLASSAKGRLALHADLGLLQLRRRLKRSSRLRGSYLKAKAALHR
jgi:CelD/BcsL family acetyltransferase involved in cellulose biosynthesis